MGLFDKKPEPIDKRYEYDQGFTAVEKNDCDQILRHQIRLLSDDKTNPDGWILKAALQFHGKDFDIEKVSKMPYILFPKTIPTSYCDDELRDAYSSYKRAINYLDDKSKLDGYAYIFGYSMAFSLSDRFQTVNDRYGSTVSRLLEDTENKFGPDCSELVYRRIVAGYEQMMMSERGLHADQVDEVHDQLLSIEDPDGSDDEDEDDEDFFDDEDEEVTLTIMKGKKSCGDYAVTISLDDEEVCVLEDEYATEITVIAGDYELNITADDGSDTLELYDDVSIESDSVLKIKISRGELVYSLDEE